MPVEQNLPLAIEWADPKAVKWGAWEIDAYGEQCSKSVGFSPGDHIIPVVKKLGGKMKYADLDQLQASERGSIEIRNPHDFTITLPIFASLAGQRFTIAHELGHYMTHYAFGDRKPMRAKRYGKGPVETEANWFASGFLMPRQHFIADMRAHQIKSRKKGKFDIAYLAAKYWVSYHAAKIRVKSLQGLI